MPRKIDPSSIQVGGGLTSPKSVEASSFVNPSQGLDGLNAHVDDPSRAHEAQAVNIFDALGLYASDDVEGALQEIGSSVSNLGQSGVVSGGTFTPSGLIVTLGATVVRNGTDRDITGDAVTLTNNATCWLYVTPAGVLTHSTGGSAPSITSPENILLWRIVTSGGAVTSSTDARFFVPNVDRKLSYTVRSEGTATDRNSEACFESLEAVLLYLEQFPSTAKKKKVVVRGQHTISTTVTISVDDVIFEGDDGAEFITGAALSPMFEVGGRSGVVFKNITFTCDDAISTALTASTPCNKFLVQDCKFESGSSDWVTCIAVTDVTATSDGLQIARCYFYSTGLAVNISRFLGLSITDCLFTSSAGSVALYLGDSATATATEGRATVSRCTIDGYDAAIAVEAHGVTVSDCSFRTVERGLDVTAGADFTIRDTTVVLGASGTIGIAFSVPRCKVINCLIENSRSVWSGVENTYGVTLVGATDAVISGTTIKSFLNTFNNSGNGVRIDASSDRCRITDIYVDETAEGIQTSAPKLNIQSFTATDVEVGIQSSGAMTTVIGANLDLSSTRGLVGVKLITGDNQCLTDVFITTSRLTNSYATDTPIGVEISSSKVSIKGLSVENLYSTTSASYGIEASAIGATFLSVTGGLFADSGVGILSGGANVSLQGIQFESVGRAIQSSGNGTIVNGCSGSMSTTYGTSALLMSSSTNRITACSFTLARTTGWTGETPVGCSITGSSTLVSSSRFNGFYNNLDDLGEGVSIGASSTDVQISDVRINNSKTGISVAASGSDIQVEGANIEAVETGISVFSSKVRIMNCSVILDSVRGDRGIFVSGTLTNISLSNCQVDGSQIGMYGIYLLSSVQMLEVNIQSCSVTGITTTGILCLGQTRRLNIRGCSVDGYLTASPYDPTANGIRIRFNSTAFPKDVSIQGCAVTRCTDGITLIGTVDLPITQVSLIGNRVTYCGWASSVPDRTSFDSVGSKGIGLDHCQNVTVQGNTVDKIGSQINSSDVEGFPTAGGSDVASTAVYLRNCSLCVISNNMITNSVSDGTAIAQGIVVDQLSSGSVGMFQTQSILINGNVLGWDSSLPGNGTGHIGIQTYVDKGSDGASHVMSDVSLNDNTVSDTQIAGISILVGENANSLGMTVFGNKVYGGGAYGLFVTLSDSTSIMSLFDVIGNVLSQSGTNSIQVDTAGSSSLQSVRMFDNTLIVSSNEMILFDIGTGSTCYDVIVDRNKFSVGSDYAVRIESGASAPFSFGRFKIRDNMVSGGNGFSIECAEYDLEDIEVTGNTLTGSLTTTLLNLTVSSTTDVTVSNIKVSDNIVDALNGGITLSVDGTISNLNVSSNRIELDSGSSSYALDVTTTPGTALSAQRYCADWTITDNLSVGGQGFRVTSSNGPSFKNFRLCENIVRGADQQAVNISMSSPFTGTSPVFDGISINDNILEGQANSSDLEAIYFLLGGASSVSGTDAVGISINQNKMSKWGNTGTQRAIWVQTNAILSGLSIDNNTITNCGSGATGTAGSGGFIDLELGQPGGSVASRNISISRNTLSNNNGGKGIYVHEMTTAGTSRLRGLAVLDNHIFGITAGGTTSHHGDGICVDLTGFANDALSVVPGDVHIDRNTVSRIDNGTVVYSDAGIVFIGPANLTVECCSVDDNSVSQTGSGSTGTILVEVNDMSDFSVSRNKIVDSSSTTAGIYVVIDGVGSSVMVESNSVQSSSGDGIRVDVTGVDAGAAGLYSAKIDGNCVISSAGDGIHIEGGAVSTGPEIQSVSLSNNRVHESVGCGVNVYLDSGAIVSGMSVNTNELYDSGDTGLKFISDGVGVSVTNLSISSNKVSVAGVSGIEFGQDSSLAIYQNVDVSGNLVSGVQEHGIWLKSLSLPTTTSTAIFGLSVCGNIVYDWSKSSSLDSYGGIKLDFLGAFQCVVSNNSMRNDNTRAYGLWFFINDQIRSMIVSNNNVHLGDEALTTTMYFDSDVSADQASMTFTGNSFRSASTAITVVGSFSPDQSILVGNTDRRTAAAGALAAFGALFTNSQVANNQD